MNYELLVYNTLSKQKEIFEPLNPPLIGMYVCGPTVYGDAHLGHARPYITFDVVLRYLRHLNYKVRYVRNITDVGHLENDADEGEDKIAKKARIEQLEPMEVVQYYTDRFHSNMRQLNNLPPSIEPRASGHIIEQIKMIEEIIENQFAYEVNGSVYFDVLKYNESHSYGKLSGRVVDDLIKNTRELTGQDEKKNSVDFALWKKASSEHIMRWPSPWSDGFPGWHLECSTMSTKYLGEHFDIHGGGMDLLFPHHECEIAQSVGSRNIEPVKYWLHNNMITIDGQKMGKSLGNFITLNELFSGENDVLHMAYSPMSVRFFILQAHYRSTLDFSNEALQAAQKGYNRLMTSVLKLDSLKPSDKSSADYGSIEKRCYEAMNDDFNTPMIVAHLFDGVKLINYIDAGKETISESDLQKLRDVYHLFVYDLLGLKQDATTTDSDNDLVTGLMDTILSIRAKARNEKNFELSDQIRDELAKLNISVKDDNEGATWTHEN